MSFQSHISNHTCPLKPTYNHHGKFLCLPVSDCSLQSPSVTGTRFHYHSDLTWAKHKHRALRVSINSLLNRAEDGAWATQKHGDVRDHRCCRGGGVVPEILGKAEKQQEVVNPSLPLEEFSTSAPTLIIAAEKLLPSAACFQAQNGPCPHYLLPGHAFLSRSGSLTVQPLDSSLHLTFSPP